MAGVARRVRICKIDRAVEVQGWVDEIGLRIDDVVMAVRAVGSARAVGRKPVTKCTVLARGSRRCIPVRVIGHPRRIAVGGAVAVDVAAGSLGRIPGRRPGARAIGRSERGQAGQRDLGRTGAQRPVGRKGMILRALVIRMASRTGELLGQQAAINVDMVLARGWRGAVAGRAGRRAVGIHHAWLHTARALVARQTGHLGRPAREVLAVAFLADTEVEAGLAQNRAVEVGLRGIQNPSRVHRGRLRFNLVIFDFDGTLADSLGWFIGISDRLADEFGFDRIDKDQVAILRRHDAATLLRLHHVPLWKVPFIAARFRRLMAQQIHMIAPFPGIADLLDQLAQAGSTLAMVTSNSCANVRRVLGKKSAGLLAACEGGVSLFGKRTKLRKVLRASGIHPAQAIFIGDEVRDIEAARQAGIASGAVAWGFTDQDVLQAHSPDFLFASVDEMLATLMG